MKILVILMVLMFQGSQDQDGHIDVFDDAVKIQVVTLVNCCVICDDASRSWSKSILGDNDGIDMTMPQGTHDQGGL